MQKTPTWVWIDGEIVPADAPLWPGLDRGALYGDGLFETMRVVDRTACDLGLHLDRFLRSATELGYPSPGVLAAGARRAARELLSHVAAADGVLRITWTRGPGARGFAPPEEAAPTVTAHFFPPPENLAARRRGVRVIIAAGLSPGSLARHKTTSSMVYVEAARRARRAGVEEALLEDGAGGLSEATSANLFAVIDGVLATPPLSLPVLPGITRGWVLAHAGPSATVRERPLSPPELAGATEVFLTGSVAGIIPVLELDGKPIGNGKPGPRTLELQAAFRNYRSASGDA